MVVVGPTSQWEKIGRTYRLGTEPWLAERVCVGVQGQEAPVEYGWMRRAAVWGHNTLAAREEEEALHLLFYGRRRPRNDVACETAVKTRVPTSS